MKDEARTKLVEQKKEEFAKKVEDKMWRKMVRKQDKEQEEKEGESQEGKRRKT